MNTIKQFLIFHEVHKWSPMTYRNFVNGYISILSFVLRPMKYKCGSFAITQFCECPNFHFKFCTFPNEIHVCSLFPLNNFVQDHILILSFVLYLMKYTHGPFYQKPICLTIFQFKDQYFLIIIFIITHVEPFAIKQFC